MGVHYPRHSGTHQEQQPRLGEYGTGQRLLTLRHLFSGTATRLAEREQERCYLEAESHRYQLPQCPHLSFGTYGQAEPHQLCVCEQPMAGPHREQSERRFHHCGCSGSRCTPSACLARSEDSEPPHPCLYGSEECQRKGEDRATDSLHSSYLLSVGRASVLSATGMAEHPGGRCVPLPFDYRGEPPYRQGKQQLGREDYLHPHRILAEAIHAVRCEETGGKGCAS